MENIGTYNGSQHKRTNKAILRTAQACRLHVLALAYQEAFVPGAST